MTERIAILIPAYQPQEVLLSVATTLLDDDAGIRLVVVDDGSGPAYRFIFDALAELPRTHVIRHAVNLGKGAALKTGLNHAVTTFPDLVGVVTADADGQHHAADILCVARRLLESPDALVLGARDFDTEVPLRSWIGNILTRYLVRLLMGQKLTDTQTGLRGIPKPLIEAVLRISSSGYEFELDMLTTAKHWGVEILEERIRTIYDHPNRVSHFNPLIDSMKIYFVLLRFGFISFLTAIIDNACFFLAFWLFGAPVWGAQVIARGIAILFNYNAARRAVFLSREKHALIFPKYLALVAFSGFVSFVLISFFTAEFAMDVIWAKVLAESTLFLANFAIQRDFVFRKKNASRIAATDWTAYYKTVPVTAKVTRRYTATILTRVIKRFCGTEISSLAEIGGANSCFLDVILQTVRPRTFHIIDLNEFGLRLLADRVVGNRSVILHNQDCRTVILPEPVDAVFSVGLIEHFDPENTREATLAHFRVLRPGGVAILSFPTPTWLYRIARNITEGLGLWKFPDERPLTRAEVLATVSEQGTVLFEKTLWPLIFTQRMIVARKRADIVN